jgi:hypothetical protein
VEFEQWMFFGPINVEIEGKSEHLAAATWRLPAMSGQLSENVHKTKRMEHPRGAFDYPFFTYTYRSC